MQETKEAGEMESYHMFSITGMDCPDCAAKLEKAIGRVPGVSEATVVFITGKLIVRFDPGRTGVAAIINRVQELGYQAREERSRASGQPSPAQARKTTMRLSGLDCPDCAAKLEKRINMVPGVEGASVNFGASRLEVIHHGPVTEILEAVRELGYVGQPEGTPAKSRH
ncbi:MAG: copper ion binding protein, partial [Syntrophomonadaceae bacterium]|nr:copper ion binding protein [Syntrophomonadaceae bacterium]